MASVTLDCSKIWRKLSSVNPATSMSALQNFDIDTTMRALTGKTVAMNV